MQGLLLFIALSFQNQPFYELYREGTKALEANEYHLAIEKFSGAIKQKPESKKNAKTYGVQYIEYYPYHKLAFAYYKIDKIEDATTALRKAYAFAENQDLSARSLMEVLDDNLQVQTEDIEDPVELPVLDTSLLTKYLMEENLGQAGQELERLEAQFPNNQNLAYLRKHLDNQIVKTNELENARQLSEDSIQKFLLWGHEAETLGKLSESLTFFQAVSNIDAGNDIASAGIVRLRKKLEDAGRADQEKEESYKAQLLANETELSEAKNRIELLNNNLIKARKDLREFENQTPPPVPTNITFDVHILPIKSSENRAHINIHLSANRGLKQVQLIINDDLIEAWELENRKEFRLPFFDNYQFPRSSNIIALKVTDINDEVFEDIRSQNFEIPTPGNSDLQGSHILLAVGTLILFLFFIKKRRSGIAFRNRFNPYIAGAPVLNDNMFYGRKSLLRQILNTIHNNSIMIFGERRIGKTSFLHQLNSLLPIIEDPYFEFIPALIDLQGVTEEHFFSTIDQEISRSLETKDIVRDPTPEHLNARLFTQRLREGIRALKTKCEKDPKLVLLLDEVDVMNEFSEKTNQQLRSVFMKSFAKHLVAVMAGIHINTTWKSQGSPWYNFFEQIELKPFSKNLATDLITLPVKGVYQFNKEAQELIIKLSMGKPYLIQKLCVNLIAHVLNENRRKVTTKDVQYVYKEIKNEVWTGA